LPVVFEALAQNDTQFLRGQLGLVAAGPGTGKSVFALTYALKARVPCLYISADSDAFTQVSRSVSILSGCNYAEAKRLTRENRSEAFTPMSGIPIRFAYDSSPSLDRIETLVDSYDEVYGDYPAMIIVDNITNVRTGTAANDSDAFAGLESLMDYLHDMARGTGAFVMGLHHVTGEYNNGDKPIPLSGLKGQIGRVPEMVLTMHRVVSDYGPTLIRVSTVKQRSGRTDASGRSFAELQFDGEHMQLTDLVGV
jgi:hypothetical protein